MTDDIWEAFRRTRVRIRFPMTTVDIRPDTDDPAPGWYPPEVTGPIHIVTAQNPMGIGADAGTNAAANERLAADLASHDEVIVWPATGYGGGPIGEEGTWSEAGFAVAGLTDREAIALAVRYEQRAIFTWRSEPGGFRLVACDGSADERRGWRATILDHV